MVDCYDEGFEQHIEEAFHFNFLTNTEFGYIDEMRLKPQHSFDLRQFEIRVNPMVCEQGIV